MASIGPTKVAWVVVWVVVWVVAVVASGLGRIADADRARAGRSLEPKITPRAEPGKGRCRVMDSGESQTQIEAD